MLTPDDHTKLAQLSTQAAITLEDATYIKSLTNANTWFDTRNCKWWYPVDDAGYPLEDAKRYTPIILKGSRGGCAINPDSITQRQPWITEGITRSAWYARRTTKDQAATLLASLPASLREDKVRGLNLHRALHALTHAHNLNNEGLWERVCKVLEGCEEIDWTPKRIDGMQTGQTG